MENSQSLKNWPKSERPRERLLERGAQALSDSELLAILFRTGFKGTDVLTLSRNLLAECGSFSRLFSMDSELLFKKKGLGAAKITLLQAIGEISRRQMLETLQKGDCVSEPSGVAAYLKMSLRSKEREIFKVLFLDKANRIKEDIDLFTGTVDQAAVYPREIVRKALLLQATAVILAHNHPSGRLEPSPEDIQVTSKIVEACRTVSVKVMDHIIVGGDGYFSFAERGLLHLSS